MQTAGQSALKASQKARESASQYLSPLGTLVGNTVSKTTAKLQEVGAVAAQKYQERYQGQNSEETGETQSQYHESN